MTHASDRQVFISYARSDAAEVMPKVELLRGSGLSVFVDSLSIEYGEDWQSRLHQALSSCDRVMVFWTAAAAASEWVSKEWKFALSIGKTVVPTLLDFTPLPEPLARLHAVTALRRREPPSGAAPPYRRRVVLGGIALVTAGTAWFSLESVVGDSHAPPTIGSPVVVQPSPHDPAPAPSDGGGGSASHHPPVPLPMPIPAPEEPSVVELAVDVPWLLPSALLALVSAVGGWTWRRRRSTVTRQHDRLKSVVDEVYSA